MKNLIEVKLTDEGQDFLTLIVKDNGVIDGYSPIFADERTTLVGIGTLNGTYYKSRDEVLRGDIKLRKGLYLYIKRTDESDPLPWEANTLKYPITGIEVREVSNV